MTDLWSLPRSKALAGARADGYAARLAGQSLYSNPYGDSIERRQADGRPCGFLHAYLNAWWGGWHAADGQVAA